MDPQTQPFDLYYVLVEVVFGGILESAIAIALILIFIGILTKMSPMLIMFLVGSFILVFGTGYAGALVVIPCFVAAFVYFAYSVVQFTRRFV